MTETMRSPRAWILLLSVLIVGFALDITTKVYAFHNVAPSPVLLEREQLLSNPAWSPIPPHDGVVAIPGRMLHFRLVLNDGAVFGIGSQKRGFFIVFTIIALCIAGWIFLKNTTKTCTLAHVGLGLILGGGLGNLYDRIFIGRVRDFMHMFPDRHLPFSWPGGSSEWFPWIFNVGDVLLLTGMGLLMVYFWRQPTPTTDQPPK
ncbi:MAG: signal peptidase II [Phycisphaerales bacterium]|jgi:signal peptidase II|nr:signal peptidase II [Phycisphaerales bacterium]